MAKPRKIKRVPTPGPQAEPAYADSEDRLLADLVREERAAVARVRRDAEIAGLYGALHKLIDSGPVEVFLGRLVGAHGTSMPRDKGPLEHWLAFVTNLPRELTRELNETADKLAEALDRIAVRYRMEKWDARWQQADFARFLERFENQPNRDAARDRRCCDKARHLMDQMLTAGAVDRTALGALLLHPFDARLTLTMLGTFVKEVAEWTSLAPRTSEPQITRPSRTSPPVAEGPTDATTSRGDGPGPQWQFHWRGDRISFARAPLRYRLCASLWDEERKAAREECEEGDVLQAVYDPHGEDSADDKEQNLKDLLKQVNKTFEEKGWPLRVRRASGKIWLDSSP